MKGIYLRKKVRVGGFEWKEKRKIRPGGEGKCQVLGRGTRE